MSNFFCDPPLCGRVEVEVKDLTLSNVEVHGDLFCHLIPESAFLSGVRERIDGDVESLRRKWECRPECACTSIQIADFEIEHSRHIHREHVYDTGWWGLPGQGVLHGNCRLSTDLRFKLAFRIHAGMCHSTDPAAIAATAAELKARLDQLRELGAGLGGALEPDTLWKRIGGASPKALRESPSVEPPRRIRRRKPATDTGG
jgi:hypothetical protein